MAGRDAPHPGFAYAVIERLEPVFAPHGFPCQRSSADDRAVLFHCDGPMVDVVRQRCPTWFAWLVSGQPPQGSPCLDLWVEAGQHGWFAALEGTGDRELAAAVGQDAVDRLNARATGSLEAWLDQVAVVYAGFLDSVLEHPEIAVDGIEHQ